MANEGSNDVSPFGMLLAAQRDMNDELKQHRVLFSDIKQNIAEQRQMHSSLVTSINNLAESIDRHEHIFEKVLSIETWRSSARLDERIGTLETWKIALDLQHANLKGRAVVIVAVVAAIASVLVYLGDLFITKFVQ